MTERPSDDPPPKTVDPARATDADLYHAYRLILGREPDDAGLAHFRQRLDEGLTVDALSEAFLDSDELRHRRERDRLAHQSIVDLGGYEVVVDRRDPDFGADIAHWKLYEEPVRQVVRDQLSPGGVCLDVGANVGVMTLLAASLVGPTGRVIAVEPNPDNVQLIYKGILRNRTTNVEVIPLAASDQRAVFSMSGRSNTELSATEPDELAGRHAQSIVLDDLLSDLPRLDLVKLDIEGHEPAALRGLTRLVSRLAPTVLLEFNPRCLERQGETPAALLDWLFARYPRVRAVSHFGDDERFSDAAALLAFWTRRAAEVADTGKVPAGHLHLDLVTE